mgnify:CR=1 FL=1
MSQEFNEMEHLERQIIKRYNELLKTLLEEGDMDTLERDSDIYAVYVDRITSVTPINMNMSIKEHEL